jgi:hypothetical protein
MSAPASGIVFIVISFWIFATRPKDLIVLAVVFNVFAAVAVVNVGGGFPIGIAPYYLAAGLVALHFAPKMASGKLRIFFKGEPAISLMRAMALFVIVCVVSAFALPNLFNGVPVDVPRAGVPTRYQIPSAPLHWSLSNLGQAIYMVLNLFVILEFLLRSEDSAFTTRIARAFEISGLLAALVGLSQVACIHSGLKFPTSIFNSNDAWAQNTNQLLAGGYHRMSATFVEPSMAGGFFASWMVFELTLAVSNSRSETTHWTAGTIATVLLILTTSSTGYVIAAATWTIAALQTLLTLFKTGLLRVRKTTAIFCAIGGAALVLLLVPGVWELFSAVLLEKQNTESAIDRSATLGRAVNVLFLTWGLGAGLGSNRAMSVLFYVLSNVGLLGTALFLYLLVKPYLMATSIMRSLVISRELRGFIRASAAALAAFLVGQLVSGAEITGSQLWVLLGMLFAGLRAAWLADTGVQSAPPNESSNSQQTSIAANVALVLRPTMQ